MKRREFIALAGAAAAFPRGALGQQAAKVPRVALVTNQPVAMLDTQAGVAAFNGVANVGVFIAEFARLGFAEGQTVAFDRYSVPNSADMDATAGAIVASGPDLIFIQGSTPLPPALLRATTKIPIVTGQADPVGAGIVANLAPTRRNLAIVSGTASSDFEGKNLSLLAEAAPAARRAAYTFAGPAGPLSTSQESFVRSVTDAATRLSVSLSVIVVAEIGDEQAFREALDKAKAAKVDMVQFGRNVQVNNASAILARLALEYRMPATSNYHAFSRAGGLMSYGQRDGEQYQKVAQYAAMILKGTDPGTLPVLQPEVFDLILNLATAKALGLAVPSSVLAQATQVISS